MTCHSRLSGKRGTRFSLTYENKKARNTVNNNKGNVMTDKQTTNWTGADDAMVENAIRRGATRRELMQMMLAGGVALTAAGSIMGRASSALAATPVKGGSLKAAGYSASNADTLDPAKASLSTDYVRCCALYNRLTILDKTGAPQMELANRLKARTLRSGRSS